MAIERPALKIRFSIRQRAGDEEEHLEDEEVGEQQPRPLAEILRCGLFCLWAFSRALLGWLGRSTAGEGCLPEECCLPLGARKASRCMGLRDWLPAGSLARWLAGSPDDRREDARRAAGWFTALPSALLGSSWSAW